jgi:hypothetical protein
VHPDRERDLAFYGADRFVQLDEHYRARLLYAELGAGRNSQSNVSSRKSSAVPAKNRGTASRKYHSMRASV